MVAPKIVNFVPKRNTTYMSGISSLPRHICHYWCSKAIKHQPCWCPKHACRPRRCFPRPDLPPLGLWGCVPNQSCGGWTFSYLQLLVMWTKMLYSVNQCFGRQTVTLTQPYYRNVSSSTFPWYLALGLPSSYNQHVDRSAPDPLQSFSAVSY